ncbi:NTP pyrophosphohydrolase [Candidatus Rhodobacter oscarellae]|uniref:NTP pyrophosphohydrolase n=1 Tax=Candidatus Rhodobacter oscarellae TaxID=1675527 RepID=A0A0J9ECU0_9RHOB|nr:NUDIX hydrolase [Candidatus Rhodobacter lobularis]KMW59549.1 NTP pyrophosphohydrolase [Candidatus Rhodobacter lobularis]
MRQIRFDSGGKTSVRTQFGALCYRVRRDEVQVLLVTSRRSGRWIIPKGWPENNATPHKAAKREAWEEAGAQGRVNGNALGIFSYVKERKDTDLPVVVVVFPMKVKSTSSRYPEAHQRRRKWFSCEKAAAKVQEPELRRMLRQFDPKSLKR